MLSLLLAAVTGAGLGVLLMLQLMRRRARTLQERAEQMQQTARRYALGDRSREIPDYGDDDLGDTARAFDLAIRELGQQLDQLSRDRARSETVLASMAEGVLVVDSQGRLQLVNDAARQLLKLDRSALGHPYIETLRHPAIVDLLTRGLEEAQASTLELTLPLTSPRTLLARVAPFESEGRGAVLVLQDVTDFRQADQMRRDFVANVSHELRTPLTAVKGYAEALLDEPDDDEMRERFLEIIHTQASRMERLVKDLLRLARLDAGQEQADVSPCDLESLLTGVVGDMATISTAKRQQVRLRVDPGVARVSTDVAKLHDIVRNLVENAVNYTPEDGLITIEATGIPGATVITVADTGPGVPASDLTRVFERFYRVDKSRARPGGTGLGLAIVKHLVQVLGGQITVANRSEGGAVFTLTLPQAPPGA
jgi:two-component system phosphate regulon sensor histidine kinase PhoR